MLTEHRQIANAGIRPSRHGLEDQGFRNLNVAYWNLGTAQLLEHAIQRREGNLASGGSFVVRTGQYTGRSPKDKFVVRDETTDAQVNWGDVNQPLSEKHFERLYSKMMAFWQGHDVYVQDCHVGADAAYGMPIRVVSQLAWHNLFARQLFIRPDAEKTGDHVPRFSILFAPDFQANPAEDGTNSETCIVINFKKRVVLICGTSYAGEMKKSAFTILNYLLPERGVFPMHCSANMGAAGDVALFFGLSGTGKTTLSADAERRLIGDDEHGWSDRGVFNFEGGCYAKCIRLSEENEPQIWNAIRFGTVLENVAMDAETRLLDFNSEEVTENTRAAYPLKFIEHAVLPSVGGHAKHVIFLTADAFGVLPPISKLTPEQAMYHFLSGYTAKVAGTEAGVKEPSATFSTCFGSPFLPLPPKTYAEMLGRRLREHNAQCWLVNTGWQGGPYGVGKRMDIPHTRAMVDAAVEGELIKEEFEIEPTFGFSIPKRCHGVPPQVLNPRNAWPDKAAYDKAAEDLRNRFAKNFENFDAPPEVKAAGPKAQR